MQLGHTDIEPIDKGFAASHGRALFLEAVKNDAPQVLADLMKVESSEAFTAWLDQYHLNIAWFARIAAESLDFNRVVQLDSFIWLPPSTRYQMSDPAKDIQPPVGLPVWKADSIPRQVYLDDVEQIINAELKSGLFSDLPRHRKTAIKDAKIELAKTYTDTVFQAYINYRDDAGNALWKQTNAKENLCRDAVWAVKYQVLGHAYNKIAKDFDKPRADGKKLWHTTVRDAVESFLNLIDIPSRVSPQGRRTGQTDDPQCSRQIGLPS